jgi:hypothetical protein
MEIRRDPGIALRDRLHVRHLPPYVVGLSSWVDTNAAITPTDDAERP